MVKHSTVAIKTIAHQTINVKNVKKAEVETNDGFNELSTKNNIGISKAEFTSKYSNHAESFRNHRHKNDSKLSKFICSLKDQNQEFDTK